MVPSDLDATDNRRDQGQEVICPWTVGPTSKPVNIPDPQPPLSSAVYNAGGKHNVNDCPSDDLPKTVLAISVLFHAPTLTTALNGIPQLKHRQRQQHQLIATISILLYVT